MPVTNVIELDEKRHGDFSLEKGQRKYTRVFHVETDTTADGPQVVQGAVGLPAVGSVYVSYNDSDAGAFLVNMTVNNLEPMLWEVTANYDSVGVPLELQGDNPL